MSHGSTPKSVLEAPQRTLTRLVVHEGATRQERRRGIALSMKPLDLVVYRATQNVPFVSDAPRRGKKVRRNARAER